MDTLLNKMAKSSTANCAINIKTLNKIRYVCIDLKCRFLVAFLVCVITFCHAGWQVTHHDMQKKLILMTYCWLTSTSKQYVTCMVILYQACDCTLQKPTITTVTWLFLLKTFKLQYCWKHTQGWKINGMYII